MDTLSPIEWQVLRLTAGAPENLEQIYDHLRESPWNAHLADAAGAVRSLVEKGILSHGGGPTGGSDEVDRLLRSDFRPTPIGLATLMQSQSSPPPGWPEGRAYPGIFAGMMPDLAFDVFKENRRDMASKRAGDDFDE